MNRTLTPLLLTLCLTVIFCLPGAASGEDPGWVPVDSAWVYAPLHLAGDIVVNGDDADFFFDIAAMEQDPQDPNYSEAQQYFWSWTSGRRYQAYQCTGSYYNDPCAASAGNILIDDDYVCDSILQGACGSFHGPYAPWDQSPNADGFTDGAKSLCRDLLESAGYIQWVGAQECIYIYE